MLLSNLIIVAPTLAMGANAGYQQYQYGEIKASDVLWTGGTAFMSTGKSFLGMNVINAGSAAGKAYLEDKDPIVAGTSSVIASSLGYGVGKITEFGSNRLLNKEYFKDKTKFEYETIEPYPQLPFISKYRDLNTAPSIVGAIFDNAFSEITGSKINEKLEEHKTEPKDRMQGDGNEK